jgi:hypothetical protein
MNNNYSILQNHSLTQFIYSKLNINIYDFFSEWHREITTLASSSCDFFLNTILSERITNINFENNNECIIKLSEEMIGAYDEVSFILLHAIKNIIEIEKSPQEMSHSSDNSVLFFEIPYEDCDNRMSHLYGHYDIQFTFDENSISKILLCAK